MLTSASLLDRSEEAEGGRGRLVAVVLGPERRAFLVEQQRHAARRHAERFRAEPCGGVLRARDEAGRADTGDAPMLDREVVGATLLAEPLDGGVDVGSRERGG